MIKIFQSEKMKLESNIMIFSPCGGTMWSFGESLDDFWLEEQDDVKLISDCGFRIITVTISAVSSALTVPVTIYFLKLFVY